MPIEPKSFQAPTHADDIPDWPESCCPVPHPTGVSVTEEGILCFYFGGTPDAPISGAVLVAHQECPLVSVVDVPALDAVGAAALALALLGAGVWRLGR